MNIKTLLSAGFATAFCVACNDLTYDTSVYTSLIDEKPAELTSSMAEIAGPNCQEDGTRIDTGIDDNLNGVLDADEIDDTTFDCVSYPNVIRNGSFETGDFTDWLTLDLTSPYSALLVNSPAPSDGSFGVITGFDGNGSAGNDKIYIAQDIDLTGLTSASLSFDWQILQCDVFNTASAERVFSLEIEPAGGGDSLFSQTIHTCIIGANSSNPLVDDQVIDISAFTGQAVRIKFQWFVPESFTGPAEAYFDDVKLLP